MWPVSRGCTPVQSPFEPEIFGHYFLCISLHMIPMSWTYIVEKLTSRVYLCCTTVESPSEPGWFSVWALGEWVKHFVLRQNWHKNLVTTATGLRMMIIITIIINIMIIFTRPILAKTVDNHHHNDHYGMKIYIIIMTERTVTSKMITMLPLTMHCSALEVGRRAIVP